MGQQMRAGYQTTIFGPTLYDTEQALHWISQSGFQGVEFFQRPDQIYLKTGKPATLTELAYLLRDHNLEFVGISGGSLKARIEFFAESEKLVDREIERKYYRPRYLALTDSAQFSYADLQEAAKQELAVAVRPQVHSPYDTPTAIRNQFNNMTESNVYWLLDAAHLYIAGADVLRELGWLPMDRIIGVMLQDWKPDYGRSYHRYARGFCTLGTGNVPLFRVLDHLKQNQYENWVVTEQTDAPDDAYAALRKAAKWFRFMDLISPTSNKIKVEEEAPSGELNSPRPRKTEGSMLQKTLRSGACSLDECYRVMAEELCTLPGARLAALWTYDIGQSYMSLLGHSPEKTVRPEIETVMNRSTAIISEAGETLRYKIFPLNDQEGPTWPLYWREAMDKAGGKYLLAVPALNRFSHRLVRLIAVIVTDTEPNEVTAHAAEQIAEDLALAADYALDNACFQAIERVHLLASQAESSSGFFEPLCTHIRDTMQCDGVTIFLADAQCLRARATTGLRWRPDLPSLERCYYADDTQQLTAQCWQSGKRILVEDLRIWDWMRKNYQARSEEYSGDIDSKGQSLLMVPLMRYRTSQSGEITESVIGVIRCRNKRQRFGQGQQARRYVFTEEDAAILEAIARASAPQIELLRNEERRVQAMARLVHELSMPLSALRATTEAFDIEVSKLVPDHRKRYKYDYIGDIYSQTSLLARVTGNAEIYGLKFGDMTLSPEPTKLMGEVIGPAVTQTRFLLDSRQFNRDRIWYSDFRDIPNLYVDRNRFQQIFFNLLSNSIKYAFKAPDQFRVEIDGEFKEGWYHIYFRDWGPGIEEAYRETIFSEGVRGPTYLNEMVHGLGIGLWVVRQIIEAHGGKIHVTHHSAPTEFTIMLPESLHSHPPRKG